MSRFTCNPSQVRSSADFFARLLLIIFSIEMIVTLIFPHRPAPVHPVVEGLSDAGLVVVLSAPLVWLGVVRPLSSEKMPAEFSLRSSSMNLFGKILTVIAMIEFTVSLAIDFFLPGVDVISGYFADACLTTVLCAPLLWWILSQEQRSQIDSLSDLLGTPLKLYLMLLGTIFIVDLVEMPLISLVNPYASEAIHKFFDSFLTTLIVSPIFWWLVVRPLRKAAFAEKHRSEAVRAQVIEAVVSINSHGLIDSFNPAAERIFGYGSGEISGKSVTTLFSESSSDLVERILTSGTLENGSGAGAIHEFPCRRKDGSNLTMEVSFSRVMLDGEPQFLILMRDITERKQADLALRTSLLLLSTTLESTADGILAVDNERRIQTFNQKFLDIWGIPRVLAEKGDARQLVVRAGEQLEAPERFLARVEEIYESPDSIGHDLIRFKDGRLIERYSQPQILEGRAIGRVWSFRDITDRTKAEQALRESEERFEIAVSGSNEGIWDWNIETGSISYSQRLKEMLGYADNEFPDAVGTFEALLHPDDHDRVAEAVLGHLKERTTYDMECRIRTREHGYRWFRTRGRAVWNDSGRAVRMAGFISDISEQKKAQEALRQSSERFRQLFEQSEDAIMFFKPGTSYIIDVNATAERLFGYTKEELKEGGIELLCQQSELARLNGVISEVRHDRPSFLDNIVNLRKDGTEINTSVRVKTVIIQGVAISFCSFRNITDRVRTEEKVREIQARLIQANKMTSLGLLVSSVAHEINNPNNFIMANSQLLARVCDDSFKLLHHYHQENEELYIGGIPFSEVEEHAPQLFEGIIEGSRRIKGIIDELKNFARPDRRLPDGEFDVNQVVSSSVSMLQHEIVKYTRNFHLTLAENIPRVRGSSQQLAQVIINLLMNACQALMSRDAGVWLSTDFDPRSGQVTIAVRDEGCGMIPENGSRIMEPFFTTKLDSGGTGLGLSICQSIVRDHGWSLVFVSAPEKGSTFSIKIPTGDLPDHGKHEPRQPAAAA